MCKISDYFNFRAVRRYTWVKIATVIFVILFLLGVVYIIIEQIEKSFDDCQGVLGDTIHKNLKAHKNYKYFKHCNASAGHSKYPYMARLIGYNETGHELIFCSGSLIKDNLVLTAGHCVDGKNLTEVHLGGTPDKNYADSIVVKKDEVKFIIHPKYRPSQMHPEKPFLDLAIIKFNSAITLSDTVNVICLPFEEEHVPKGLTLTTWQDLNIHHPKIAEIPIEEVDLLDCSQRYFNYALQNALNKTAHNVTASASLDGLKNVKIKYRSITDTQFCAGDKTLDRGNSGMAVSTVNNKNGASTIYGLVSYGVPRSDGDFPTVFTKIHSHRHWILCST